jgi:phospholipid/cholesterol/gamma-HCH transport system permease protein
VSRYNAFAAELGAMTRLAVAVVRAAFRPPFDYGPELTSQFMFALRLGWFPMAVSSVAIAYGPIGIQAATFLGLLGALDRLGGIFVIAIVREFAPLVCAIVMAGVAGTAMCADLGARKVREELDALVVLGIDPVKSLVVPRFLSLVTITSLFNVFALVFGTLGGLLASLASGAPQAAFFTTYFANASALELGASFVKTAVFGGIIAIVCCYKGLNASGGAEGVGRAVNQAVVIAFLAIGSFDYVFTQTLLALNPSLSVLK